MKNQSIVSAVFHQIPVFILLIDGKFLESPVAIIFILVDIHDLGKTLGT